MSVCACAWVVSDVAVLDNVFGIKVCTKTVVTVGINRFLAHMQSLRHSCELATVHDAELPAVFPEDVSYGKVLHSNLFDCRKLSGRLVRIVAV